ncbi:peptidase inhibitor family I36 protein [Micromonospora sp. NBC_01412]|uniref:peptidase inhibitor family I36 protein n=1 Tax=Micromonospora sp. NBC_01412 TaxID=2903590 RepID=UPI003248F715
MLSKRRLISLLLAAFCGLSVSVVGATGAQAASPGAETCWSYNVSCLFEHNDWQGSYTMLHQNTPDLGGWNDHTSSVINDSWYVNCYYEHANYNGWRLVRPRGTWWTSMGDYNDQITSVRFSGRWDDSC